MTKEEKLEEAKRLYKTANADQKYVLESLFPELKESEDERIRKELIFYFQEEIPQCSIQEHADKMKEFIAWLEKQGEQPKKHDVCNNCDQQGSCVSPCPMKLVEKQGEQNPAWSEEDETIKNNISHIIRQYDKMSKKENKPCWYISDCLLWMQNIKDRIQPQPKKEWSEEDNRHIKWCIEWLDSAKMINNAPLDVENIKEQISWLKSLRPQNRWKPSEEEMKLLREVQQGLLGKDCHNRFVNFMYKLKRLREE